MSDAGNVLYLPQPRAESACKTGNCSMQIAFNRFFWGVFVPLSDLHNLFNDSDVVQTVCANKLLPAGANLFSEFPAVSVKLLNISSAHWIG